MKEELNEILHKMRGSIVLMVGLGNFFRQWLEKQDKSQLKEMDFYNEMCSHADALGARMKELAVTLDAWADKHVLKD